MTKRKYCFELRSNPSELRSLCNYLEDFGNKAELPQKCLFELNLGLDELFTNIISYGFKDESEHQIKFTLAKHRETVVVQVEDDGIPFNPLKAGGPDLAQDLDSIKIGGLGIHLIKKMMDDIEYQRAGSKNKLTLKKGIDVAG